MAALALTATAGCNKSDGPATVKAAGQVTHKGQPVEGATVTFVPPSGKGAAVGMTDAAGRFRLMASGRDGALPGAYKVTVTKTDAAAAAAPQATDAEAMRKADMQGMGAAAKADAKPKDLLPGKYSAIDQTPLTAEVPEGGKTDFAFDLAD